MLDSALNLMKSCQACPIIGTVLIGGVVLYLWRRRRRVSKHIIHKKDYKNDVVYLYQFPSCETIVSISPFALKVESYLRLNKIPYESIRGVKKWSSKGQIPFIELNGEEFADSNLILSQLEEHFKISENHLSEYEQGITRTISMMLDQQTVFSYFYYRYVIAVDAFIGTWGFIQGFKRWFVKKSFPSSFKKKAFYQGIGRFSTSEICQVGLKDLKAISQILGDKAFIHGDKPSLVDCYAFCHLAQLLYIPAVDYPHTKFIRENCPNLVDYTERFKQMVWPDWNRVCQENLQAV